MSRRGQYWALVLLTGLAFVVRVHGLAFQSLWRDEIDSLRFASQPFARLLASLATSGHNGPLYYLFLRPWLDVSGQSEFSLRFFSVIMGVLAVPLVYRLGLHIVPRWPAVGLIASLLAATSPYLVWYSQEARMYAAVVCIVLVSMRRFLVAVERGGWQRWLGYVMVTGTAFYVHLVTVLIVPAQIGFFLVLRGRRKQGAHKWFCSSLAVLCVPYLPLLAWQLPLLLRPAAPGYALVPLSQMLASLMTSYGGGVLERSAVWTLAPLLSLLAAATILALPDRQIGPISAAAIWLLVPVLGFFLLTLLYPLFTARYLIFVLPALLLLMAMGILAVGRRSTWLAGLLLVALLATNVSALWLQARTPVKADYRSATQYVVSRMVPEDKVLFQIPYGRYSFEYYLGHSRISPSPKLTAAGYHVFLPLAAVGSPSTRWIDGLYTNGGMSPGEVDQQMAGLVGDCRVVWLVASEVAIWDERGLVQGWLDSHATLTDRAEFVRVSVRRYLLP